MSPIYESETRTRDDLEKLRKTNVCAVCGEWLNMFLDKDTGLAFVACKDWLRTHHEGIMREASPYQQKGLESLTIAERRKIMEQQHGEETTRALEKYHGVTSLTKPEALEILQSVFPNAPEKEMTRAVLLCTSYSLNPLMGHVFLIPFKGEKGTTWATILGIKAKRLLASRRHPISYVDDTPRLMSVEEQKRIYGKVDDAHICAITVLKNPATNAEARGYGKWKRSETPYGTDKGNSAENMAFIRSESQALDRLCPGEMPAGIEVIDERFAGDKDTVEGEYKEVEEETPTAEEPAKEKTKAKPKAKPPVAKAPEAEAKEPEEPEHKEPEPDTLEAFKETMQLCNWTATDVGKYANSPDRTGSLGGWNIRDYDDLKPEQIKELIAHINKNPK